MIGKNRILFFVRHVGKGDAWVDLPLFFIRILTNACRTFWTLNEAEDRRWFVDYYVILSHCMRALSTTFVLSILKRRNGMEWKHLIFPVIFQIKVIRRSIYSAIRNSQARNYLIEGTCLHSHIPPEYGNGCD